ncbi:hypothetical protein B0H17DRAFT_1205412 [Mycena rosella]|uniref:Uncharacterized protein n=1 Tax=Mycena rosella TaxID=1033263 RepID=A0AAD7DAP3_MYCRO|nr:hypothetical protein B0H17DRAFT_1205412 [Mycena rosella]
MLVTFECIAVLENPRIGNADKPRTVTLDAQIYLGGSLPSLTISAFKLWIQASRMNDAVAHHSDALASKDYHFAGDILDLVYLGPADELDVCHRAIVHALGTVDHPNTNDSTFEVHAEQYIAALKGPGPIYFKVLIPDIPRYKNKKPVPNLNSRVMVTGFIMDVQFLLDDQGNSGVVSHFIVDMNSVQFLGLVPKAVSDTPGQKPIKTEGTPAQLKFNFGQQHLRTPTPRGASRKRPRPEREEGEILDEDKGEGSSKRRR